MSDGEYPKCFKESKRKARKIHKCSECLGIIQKGEPYVYSSGIWDISPQDFKTCVDCHELRDEVAKTLRKADVWSVGVCYEELAAEIDELGEPYFIMKFNQICQKRNSKLRIRNE